MFDRSKAGPVVAVEGEGKVIEFSRAGPVGKSRSHWQVPPARKIAKDLREYGSALWTLAHVEGIEPTNNIAERSLRKAVLWRKSSFGSASPAGSLFVERMLTVCESLRAQGRSILDFLVETMDATANGRVLPSLLPARV